MKIGIIGGGNMASAILEGCLAQGFTSSQFYIIEINAERRVFIKTQWHVKTAAHITADITLCDVIILAVKPQDIQKITLELDNYLQQEKTAKNPLIISIAAGISLASLNTWLTHNPRIVRAMPNIAALVHAGITGLTATLSVTSSDRTHTEKLMSAIGDILWLENETQLDAVTAVSGSGPAYVFYFIEALQQAAETLGLSSEQAKKLALKTFEGASHLAAISPDSAQILKEKVTSKGGTTEAALKHLDQKNVKQYFIEAIQCAEKRSKQLGSCS